MSPDKCCIFLPGKMGSVQDAVKAQGSPLAGNPLDGSIIGQDSPALFSPSRTAPPIQRIQYRLEDVIDILLSIRALEIADADRRWRIDQYAGSMLQDARGVHRLPPDTVRMGTISIDGNR